MAQRSVQYRPQIRDMSAALPHDGVHVELLLLVGLCVLLAGLQELDHIPRALPRDLAILGRLEPPLLPSLACPPQNAGNEGDAPQTEPVSRQFVATTANEATNLPVIVCWDRICDHGRIHVGVDHTDGWHAHKTALS